MQKITKPIAFFVTLVILFLLPPVSANAAPNKPAEVKCKKTNAKGKPAKNIATPEIKEPFKNKTMTFTTNCGDIVIAADGINAPITVTALSALANSGFFNKTICHRLVTDGIYVLQCGDPTATGMGGPNFKYRDENLPLFTLENYPAGVVAMANSGPNTNGSQFFIVYEDTSMKSSYTIWGKVIKGLDIVKAIAKAGVADGTTDGMPKQTIAIEKVRVR